MKTLILFFGLAAMAGCQLTSGDVSQIANRDAECKQAKFVVDRHIALFTPPSIQKPTQDDIQARAQADKTIQQLKCIFAPTDQVATTG